MKIIFLGGQGSGKSTQAKLLSQELKLPYLEMGQILRDRMEKKDELASKIKSALTAGSLVENGITNRILREKLNSLNSIKGYILDGFPRNFVQLNALDPNIDLVFYIKVSDEEATKRLIQRARSDDTKEVLEKRLQIFHQETGPLLAKFREKEILREVEGDRPINEIQKEVSKIVNSFGKYQ